MSKVSKSSTPRERLARLFTVLRRTRTYWRSSLLIAGLGAALSLLVALASKREWRSETTVLYRSAIRTGKEAESSSVLAARLGPKLKDMLSSRAMLGSIVEEFDLFPEKRQRSMLDAIEEMQSHVAFRARNGDSFVISFVYDDPRVARDVTAKLAEAMITDHNRENLDAATLNRDFLERDRERADKEVEAASRALATFLAKNPQFQWGNNESPYAPQQIGAGGIVIPGVRPQPASPRAPRGVTLDGPLGALLAELARVDAELAPPAVASAPPVLSGAPDDAQKQRDAAAATLGAARAALAEKLLVVTAAHPDAVAARAKVAAAEEALAAAEARVHARRPVDTPMPYLDELTPAQRGELAKERAGLERRIAERRAELAGGMAAREPAAEAGAPASSAAPDVVELETEWHRLRLDLDRAREHLHAVQVNARAAELSAEAAEKNGHAEMLVLDPAYVPTRPDKGRGRVFLAGAVMALFLALGVAGTRVLLDDTLYDEDDVALAGGPELIVTLPRVRLDAPELRAIVATAPEPEPPAPSWAEPPLEPVEARSPSPAIPLGPTRPEPRPRNDTLRFGAMDGSDGLRQPWFGDVNGAAEFTEIPRGSALAVRSVGMELVADVRPPDVEIVGADLEPEGEGVLGLLRASPPGVLASLRVLRHRLEQRRGGSAGGMVVSVLSPGVSEGKTTLAARLAMILCEADRARVVLVEANLERPTVARALGLRLPEGVGFTAQIHRRMLGGRRPWGTVRLAPSLCALAEPGDEAEFPGVLHSMQFDAALQALRAAYDYVVVDGPAVLGSGDATVVEDASDVVVLVARAARTSGSALRSAAEQLGSRRILGVVLNDVALAGRARGGA